MIKQEGRGWALIEKQNKGLYRLPSYTLQILSTRPENCKFKMKLFKNDILMPKPLDI